MNISNWSIQYVSANSTEVKDDNKFDIPENTTIASGGYFLIKLAAGNNLEAADFTADLDALELKLGSKKGKVFLVSNNEKIV